MHICAQPIHHWLLHEGKHIRLFGQVVLGLLHRLGRKKFLKLWVEQAAIGVGVVRGVDTRGEGANKGVFARALHGQMGDLVDSAHGMATLFALDRYGAREVLDRYADSDEVLLLDRYVASNAAYTAARLKDDAAFDWVYDLEFGQLGLPVPHPGRLRKRWRAAGAYFCRLPAVSRETVGQSVAD
mgnify:CR=1 FL=1